MFAKLKALYNLMKMGEQVANPAFWKKVQAEGQPVIAALLIAIVGLLKGTKYEIPLDNETALLIAGGIFAAVNWVLTVVTTKKMGLPAKPTSDVLPEIQPELIIEPTKEQEGANELFPLTPALIAEAREAMVKDRRSNRTKNVDSNF